MRHQAGPLPSLIYGMLNSLPRVVIATTSARTYVTVGKFLRVARVGHEESPVGCKVGVEGHAEQSPLPHHAHARAQVQEGGDEAHVLRGAEGGSGSQLDETVPAAQHCPVATRVGQEGEDAWDGGRGGEGGGQRGGAGAGE